MVLLVLKKKISCESLRCFETLVQLLLQTQTSHCKMKLKSKLSFSFVASSTRLQADIFQNQGEADDQERGFVKPDWLLPVRRTEKHSVG